MKKFTVADAAHAIGGEWFIPDECMNTEISLVTSDSRLVCPGALFIAICGARVDGHDFIESALTDGASLCIGERAPKGKEEMPYIQVESSLAAVGRLAAWYRSTFDIPVVGITGSVGKTTTKEMVWSVLRQKYETHKTQKNFNNELGVPQTLLAMPEASTAAVIEMGISDFGEMTRLGQMVRPDLCVMTNIGYCHLECLGDLNGVLKAKSEVFAQMAEKGIAVVNGDDELLSAFDPGLKKITYGISENNDFRAEEIKDSGTEGIDCVMTDGERRFSVHIPAFGSHMVLAALAAAAVSKELGLTDEEIANGLLGYKAVGGRANVTDTGKYTVINDCYNANPNSVRAALTSLAGLNGRKVAILGDMFELGADSDALHESVGVFAAEKGIDLLICCGENSKHLYQGFIKTTDKESYHFTNRDTMIATLPTFLEKGDNILVKASHGMHFDAVVEALLKSE
ncbi:MAG: UDP-N-acetylmuramoyl-tripeptide--D-alanyl-D-alanine ligase [Firmicutes bacterium]|nr:UDP-N-acetylmuramoyl-tripeptide--D-alanyl-D-alanine ligase [Bacillota bacterium]